MDKLQNNSRISGINERPFQKVLLGVEVKFFKYSIQPAKRFNGFK